MTGRRKEHLQGFPRLHFSQSEQEREYEKNGSLDDFIRIDLAACFRGPLQILHRGGGKGKNGPGARQVDLSGTKGLFIAHMNTLSLLRSPEE